MANEENELKDIIFRKTQDIDANGELQNVLIEVHQQNSESANPQFITAKIAQPYHSLKDDGLSIHVGAQSSESAKLRGPDYHEAWITGYRVCLKDVRENRLLVRRQGPWGKVLFRSGEGSKKFHNSGATFAGECGECSKKYTTKWGLKKHILTKHASSKSEEMNCETSEEFVVKEEIKEEGEELYLVIEEEDSETEIKPDPETEAKPEAKPELQLEPDGEPEASTSQSPNSVSLLNNMELLYPDSVVFLEEEEKEEE